MAAKKQATWSIHRPESFTKKKAKGKLMKRRSKSRRTSQRTGAAAVEFALVAPLFLVFLFGTIEMGRLALARNVLANASREAARFAIIEGADEQDVIDLAEHFATVGSVEGVTATVTYENSTASVRVSIPFNEISWLPGAWFLRDQTLAATTTMRIESIEVVSTGSGS